MVDHRKSVPGTASRARGAPRHGWIRRYRHSGTSLEQTPSRYRHSLIRSRQSRPKPGTHHGGIQSADTPWLALARPSRALPALADGRRDDPSAESMSRPIRRQKSLAAGSARAVHKRPWRTPAHPIAHTGSQPSAAGTLTAHDVQGRASPGGGMCGRCMCPGDTVARVPR